MRKSHLSPSVIFNLHGAKKESIPYAFSFDYKNLALSSLKSLKNTSKIISFAGLNFYKGLYNNKKVIVANAGTYAPDTAIGTEILCFLGARYLVRIGSCGSLHRSIGIGDVVLSTSVLDDTGVTKFYQGNLKVSEPINKAIMKALPLAAVHRGRVWSYDALFQETREMIKKKLRLKAIAVDMASASFLKVTNCYKRKGSVCLVVSDNLATGTLGFTTSMFYQKLHAVAGNIFKIAESI